MRKTRLICWILSLVVCSIIIIIYQQEKNTVPYEERTAINFYCPEKFQQDIKKIIEKSSLFKKTHKVVFVSDKSNAEFILTDKITQTEEDYVRVGWSPLVVAFDNQTKGKVKNYTSKGYLVESDNTYTIDFEKVIDDTLNGEWKDKIYCPQPNTREGELFFDFLLININHGIYPKSEEELEYCIQIANQFLNSSIVMQTNVVQRLKHKLAVENELYVLLESNLYDMKSDNYEFDISYPINTVLEEYYYGFQGANQKDLKEVLEHEKWTEYGNRVQNIMHLQGYRYNEYAPGIGIYFHVKNGFSYVEIPLKEE